MQCPECGGEATKIPWHADRPGDKTTAIGFQANQLKGHPMLALAGVGWLVTKRIISTAWRCSRCGHTWTRWFD
jgi:hypothetical protein